MRTPIAIFGLAAILSLPVAAMAAGGQSDPQEKHGRVVAQTVVEKHATVKAIDMDKRTVTLLLSDGREETLLVDKAVKKLGQVKVGDKVNARYQEAISIKINKVKVAPGVSVEASVKPDEQSVKPKGTADVRVTTTATIEKIFDNGKKVTLKMPDGKTSDVEVRDPENLRKIKTGEVKQGDQIEITYKRALALSVEKAQK